MKLGYLPQPGMSAGAGVGSALGAFGKTMSDLGQLGLDDKALKAKTEADNLKLDLLKNADKRGDVELTLKKEEIDGKNTKYANEEAREQAKLLNEAIKSKNMVSAFRIAHPNATKDLSDDELKSWGNDIDKLLPKDRMIKNIDTRITPDGDKVLTYMDNGKILERNMGKVKTDWNMEKDKGSSKIPLGSVAVPADFANDHWRSGALSQMEDGRYYVDIKDRETLVDGSYYQKKRDKFVKQKEFDNALSDKDNRD